MPIEALRTPDERFSVLPGYPYEPRYVEDLPGYEGLRMARVDEGPPDAEHTFLCLHGEPTWGYLYRQMMPVFLESGARVVVPDLFGFGRSDKPVDDAVYTFDFHRDSLLRLVEQLDLERITLVCQDWGGILGLTLPLDLPGRFARLLVMNTAMPIGEPISDGFAGWKGFAAMAPEIPVAGLVASDAQGDFNLMDAIAYDAPFPDDRYKAGVRRFPQMVATSVMAEGVNTSRAAAEFWQNRWRGETFMAIGMRDEMLGPEVMGQMRQLIHGCPTALEIPEAGHFVQEHGVEVAEQALRTFGL